MLTKALFFVALTTAKTIDIHVSNADPSLTFTPSSTTAVEGDELVFHFFPEMHNVVQSTFENPCQPMDNGFYSGFVPSDSGEANTTFSVSVTDDSPIWYYCSSGSHCNAGMVGVINPPSDHSIDDYKNASSTADTITPSVAGGSGGSLSAADATSSAATSSSTTATLTSSSSTISASGTIGASGTISASVTAVIHSLVPSSGALALWSYQVPAAVALVAGALAAV